MTLDEYLSENAAVDLAKAVKATAAEISDWRRNKRQVPVRRCVPIEIATGGQVTRKDLRPDDWAEYWPELAEESAA